MSIIRFTNCGLCDQGNITKQDLWVDTDKGIIVNAPSHSNYETVDLGGLILAPGFIDIQINGAFGLDFGRLSSDEESEKTKFVQDYNDAMKKYLTTGVTSACPTFPSSFAQVYHNTLPLVTSKRTALQTESLGAHVEGPFISPQKKGCHPEETLVKAPKRIDSISEVYGAENFKHIKIITAAPEVEGIFESIPSMVSNNITYSIGHTMSSYEKGMQAVKQGATMITHLYNAMPQPHHRNPGIFGLIGAPTQINKPFFGIVADGIHVHPAAVNIAYKSAPDKCILVTDAMSLIGLPDGTYKWDDQYIEKNGHYLHLQGTDTIAGSATTLPECLRNLMKWSSLSLAEAVKTVTNNPALSIGVQDRKGFLKVGCDADFTILDQSGEVKIVYKLGKKIQTHLKSSAL